ncbi:hypothetical protein AB1N83_004022 [Pleurotus pulmonarius]
MSRTQIAHTCSIQHSPQIELDLEKTYTVGISQRKDGVGVSSSPLYQIPIRRLAEPRFKHVYPQSLSI